MPKKKNYGSMAVKPSANWIDQLDNPATPPQPLSSFKKLLANFKHKLGPTPKKNLGTFKLDKSKLDHDHSFEALKSVVKDLPPEFPAATRRLLDDLASF